MKEEWKAPLALLIGGPVGGVIGFFAFCVYWRLFEAGRGDIGVVGDTVLGGFGSFFFGFTAGAVAVFCWCSRKSD